MTGLLVALVGVVAGLAGCGTHERHAQVTTGTRVIYTALPSRGPFAAAARAVYDGEQLALSQAGGLVGRYRIVLRRLGDTPAGGLPTTTSVTAAARLAANDPKAVAYIGDLIPGSSAAAVPILSRAGILQASPGDSVGTPSSTFVRLVPSVFDEARALLEQLTRHGLFHAYLVHDRSAYGSALATAVTTSAPDFGVQIVDPAGAFVRRRTSPLVKAIKHSTADGLLYAGLPESSLASLWNGLAAAGVTIRKFAPAAITYSPDWSATTAAARYDTYLSTPGSAQLPRAGGQFQSDLADAYGPRVPWTGAIFGYIAMTGVLDALYKTAGLEPTRARVAAAFLHARSVPSALGTYSITAGHATFSHYYFTTYHRDGVLGEPPTGTGQ